MVRKGLYSIAAGATLIVTASAVASGLFAEAPAPTPEPQRQESPAATAPTPDRMAYLRLQIDAHDNVTLLDRQTIDAQWKPRDVPDGTRLYYEVLDGSGSVLACGLRQDPRDAMRINGRQPVNFILTVPHNDAADKVVLYSMGYELGGRANYEHSLRPIATIRVR
jgi:hypothetical protein